MDSSGPDVKVRGTAAQIFDKYVALARDAASSGNRIKAENLRQHAEHYQRLVNAIEAAKQAAREEAEAARSDDSNDEEDEDKPRKGRRYPPRAGRDRGNDNEPKAEEQSGLEVVTPDAGTNETAGDDNSEGSDEAKSKRRRKAPSRKPAEETIEAAE